MSYITTKFIIKEYTKNHTTFNLESFARGTVYYNRRWYFIDGRTTYGDAIRHVFDIWITYDRFLLDASERTEL